MKKILMVCQHSTTEIAADWQWQVQVQLGKLNVELSEEPIRDDIC